MRGEPQIFSRDGQVYYWSLQDGEVCVVLEKSTPAEIWLHGCDGEPFRSIRRGEPLFDEAMRLYAGHEPTLDWLIRTAGTPVRIYYRDGYVRVWSFKRGEMAVKVKLRESGTPFPYLQEIGGKRAFNVTPTHTDQLAQAVRDMENDRASGVRIEPILLLGGEPRTYGPLEANPERDRLKRKLMRG